MEKDRARREQGALLAHPAAGFAALSGDEFFAALKQACQDGTANPALIADCERRITSGGAGPRALHQVLLAASDRHVWAGGRALALAAAGQVPGHRGRRRRPRGPAAGRSASKPIACCLSWCFVGSATPPGSTR